MAVPLAHPRFPRVFALVAGVIVSLCGAARAQDDLNAAAKREVLDELQTTLVHQAYVGGVRFSQWADHEAKYFDRLDQARSPEAFAGVVNRALAEFGISHAALLPPSAFKQMERTEVVGIGVSVRLANDGLRVLRVMPDSPAATAQIAPGDIIIEIDGKRPKEPEDLEGEPDSVAKLRLRKLNGERIEIEVARKRIQTRTPATLTILDAAGATVDPDAALPNSPDATPGDPPHSPIRNYGLLRLPTFGQEYDEDEIKGLFTRCMDLSGLIIDLRGNGGGAVNYMQHFLSFMIIEETPIGVAVSGQMAARYVEATGEDPSDVIKVAAWSTDKLKVTRSPIRPFPRPIVVLLNGGSAAHRSSRRRPCASCVAPRSADAPVPGRCWSRSFSPSPTTSRFRCRSVTMCP
ncbi:MAG: S41 family peptidase [Phycisphaerales bacterium]|jgi:C-terminal processing protease CtpA/Prc